MLITIERCCQLTEKLNIMGWDKKRFVHQTELMRKLECSICSNILKSPLRNPCQHLFCKDCIIQSFNDGNNQCPVDKEPLSADALIICPSAQQLLNNLIIKCKFEDMGCILMCKLEKLDELIEHEDFLCVKNVDCKLNEFFSRFSKLEDLDSKINNLSILTFMYSSDIFF